MSSQTNNHPISISSLRKYKNIFSFKNDSINFSPQFDLTNKKQKVLILGDSHSKDLFNIFKTNEKNKSSGNTKKS